MIRIDEAVLGNGCAGLLSPIVCGTGQGQQPAMMVVESKFGFDGLAPRAGGGFQVTVHFQYLLPKAKPGRHAIKFGLDGGLGSGRPSP